MNGLTRNGFFNKALYTRRGGNREYIYEIDKRQFIRRKI